MAPERERVVRGRGHQLGCPASGEKHDDDDDRRELDATSEPKREGGCCDSKHECQGSIVRPDVWRMLIKHMYIDCQLAFPASFFLAFAFAFALSTSSSSTSPLRFWMLSSGS